VRVKLAGHPWPAPREYKIQSVGYNSPLAIIRHMTIPDGIYVLYKDVPRRRYRRIAAKSEESPSHLPQPLVRIPRCSVVSVVRKIDNHGCIRSDGFVRSGGNQFSP
jgi:hypothetical protein